MNYFLDLCNLLTTYWEFFLTHPMLLVSYTVLVFALAWTVRGFVVKNDVNDKLINARNALAKEIHRQQNKNSELEQRIKRLTEQNQKLQNDNEELGQRIRELNLERIGSLRKMEQLEAQKTSAEGKLRVLYEFLQTRQ